MWIDLVDIYITWSRNHSETNWLQQGLPSDQRLLNCHRYAHSFDVCKDIALLSSDLELNLQDVKILSIVFLNTSEFSGI